eukprot:TRINITY_DN4526_c0_g1_i1.p1 TRINITY_DN4526_c0_g1~~TRINITY_DN4526_c0_g1_i1.p1  ORF type:complete len:491 (-),score=94.57 TRINITY_DN4526_c0_g1_i1:93-1430(-)
MGTHEPVVIQGLENKIVTAYHSNDTLILFATIDNQIYCYGKYVEDVSNKDNILNVLVPYSRTAKYLFTPDKKILCLSLGISKESAIIVCEDSVIVFGNNSSQQLAMSERKIVKPTEVLQLKDKHINFAVQSTSFSIFASLWGKEDKVYYCGQTPHAPLTPSPQSGYTIRELPLDFLQECERIIKINCAGKIKKKKKIQNFHKFPIGAATFFLTDFGNVYRCGSSGHFANCHTSTINTPTRIELFESNPILAVANGYYHCIVIGSPNNVDVQTYGWGYNTNGELCTNGDLEAKSTAITLPPLKHKVLGIYVGYFHACVLVEKKNKKKKVISWGYGSYGQLGDKDFTAKREYVKGPTNISKFLSNIVSYDQWTPQIHTFFSSDFKDAVFTFYLCLHRNKNYIRVPKYVVYEIIKRINILSFSSDSPPDNSLLKSSTKLNDSKNCILN